jgi:hypothetical protein
MADIGKLDTAVALVAKETLQDFKQWSGQSAELLELVNVLEKETLERQAILDMRLFEMQGYMAGIINDNPADLGPFDKELLLKAREQFIPGGLTDESLESFKKKMSESGYSQEQRREIGAAIARISIVLMVEEIDRVPWDAELPRTVQRDMLSKLVKLGQFCEACGVKMVSSPGRYAIPVFLGIIESEIKMTLGEHFKPVVLSDAPSKTDVVGLAVSFLPEIRAKRDVTDSFERLKVALNQVKDDFLLNMLAVSVGCSGETSYSEANFPKLMMLVDAELAVYKGAEQMSVERYSVGMRAVKLITPMLLASRRIPVSQRPDMFNIALEAREMVADLEEANPELLSHPEVQQLKCLLALIYNIPVPVESLAVIAQSPTYQKEAAYLSAWQRALWGLEPKPEVAEQFLQSTLSTGDPITTALVLHHLGRNEDAFQLLEQLVGEDVTWQDDLQGLAGSDLAGLRAVHYIRYDEISGATEK